MSSQGKVVNTSGAVQNQEWETRFESKICGHKFTRKGNPRPFPKSCPTCGLLLSARWLTYQEVLVETAI